MKLFPAEVKDFFYAAGISDMRVISEIIPLATLDNGLLLYGDFFHIVGRMENASKIILEIPCCERRTDSSGNNVFVKTGTKTQTVSETAFKELTDSFEIMFTDKTALVPENFPKPLLQLEIKAHIPWIIDEENTY
ncbi:MAG: hypothetical protein K6B74_00655 [Ruminococcus sp.]|nr:hypothetical protein [Ruminococcus sp.]